MAWKDEHYLEIHPQYPLTTPERKSITEFEALAESEEKARILALEESVDAEDTGLVAKVSVLEAASQTAKVGAPVTPVAAGAILTAADALSDGNTVKVNDVTYTFRTALTTEPSTVPNEVLIGANKEASMTNLKKAINAEATEGTNYSTDTEQPTDVTATVDGAVVTCTAGTAGIAGNAYPKAAVGANLDWDGTGEVFSGGVNGTTGVSGEMRFEVGAFYISAGVSTVAVSKWEKYSKDAE